MGGPESSPSAGRGSPLRWSSDLLGHESPIVTHVARGGCTRLQGSRRKMTAWMPGCPARASPRKRRYARDAVRASIPLGAIDEQQPAKTGQAIRPLPPHLPNPGKGAGARRKTPRPSCRLARRDPGSRSSSNPRPRRGRTFVPPHGSPRVMIDWRRRCRCAQSQADPDHSWSRTFPRALRPHVATREQFGFTPAATPPSSRRDSIH